ncbi:hypothetical protein MGN70_001060 [Eutypa lata]|nr:hypothetical protein MGN70_001060 [Eutypa lata]
MATQELSTELPSHSQVTRVDNVGEWRSTARPRVLANSAVEFIETQPEKAFGSEVATKLQAQALQYAPEYDKFVSESGFPHQDYFKESQERSAQFKKTLLDFCKILKKQNLDGTLGIKLKEPESYTLKDVTEIAQKLQERKQQSESTTGCLGAIRRLFKRALNEKGVLTSMLNFIPNDTYGTLISGGFTMILAAVDRNESLRDEVHSALAEIPRKLEDIKTMLEVHYQSPKLKFEADGIIVEIFGVLNAIISELSRNKACTFKPQQ